MKKQVQEQGVRKWFGDDFIGMQDEIYKAIETGLLGGDTGIVSGVQRTQNGSDYTFSSGIVMIDGKLHSFSGHTSTNGTIYLVPAVTNDTRAYLVGGDKNITTNNNTDVVYTQPASGSYIKCDNSTKNRYFMLKTDDNNTFSQEFKDIVNSFVASKYYLREPIQTWTVIPGATYAASHVLGTPRYMIDSLGYYHFTGYWNCNVANLPANDDYLNFMNLTIPTIANGSDCFVVREILSGGTIKERLVFNSIGTLKIEHLGDTAFGIDLRHIPPLKGF